MSTTTSNAYNTYFDSEYTGYNRAEADTHADTSAVGKDALIVLDTGQTVSVHPFTEGLQHLEDVPIVTGAIAFACPTTLNTYILFIHEALYIKSLKNHLICPAQVRHNGVTFNDTPLAHIDPDKRCSADHSIVTQGMHIPLRLDGVISYFQCRKPTLEEVQSDRNTIHIHLTSSAPWNPKDPGFSQVEDSLRATEQRSLQ